MYTYLIAEIGQNHNGSMELAKKMIDLAALPVVDMAGRQLAGIDAVKFQMRDLSAELTDSEMSREYTNPHSFGRTYGEHRSFLEFNEEQFLELFHYTKTKKMDFVITLCGLGCLKLFNYFRPDKLKVASRDLTNLPLLTALAETKIPLILSTGMAGERELNQALEVIIRYHNNITILHCLSEYPADFAHLNLYTITYLRERYPQYQTGYSDHSLGIVAPVVAVGLGARVIEKHVTLSRGMKGSDHAGALGPDGLLRMVRDIRHIELSMGEKRLFAHPAATAARSKLERSIATKRDLRIGDVIKEEDLHLLSPGTGYRWSARAQIVGKVVTKDLKKNELVLHTHVCGAGDDQVISVITREKIARRGV